MAAPSAPAAATPAPADNGLPPYDPHRPWANLGVRPSQPEPAAAPQGPAPAAAAQTAPAAPTAGVVGGRRYSVHRDFGEQPDPIPAPDRSSGPVLVGPGPAPADLAAAPAESNAGGVGAEPDPNPTPRNTRRTSSTSSH